MTSLRLRDEMGRVGFRGSVAASGYAQAKQPVVLALL
jgi:hypothetical protein